MNKNFLVIMIVTIGAMIGLFLAFGGKKSDNTTFEGDPFAIQADDNKKGSDAKGVTVIEYGDFECPACLQSEPYVKQILSEYGDDIQFVFRHFPLSQVNPQMHPNAFAAHRAAQAAANQGKFWEMHDILYNTQTQWDRQNSGLQVADAIKAFESYATQIGLDMEKFKVDASSEAVNNYIKTQVASGSKLGITGTPSFYVNGEKIDAPQTPESYAAFKAKLDSILGDKKTNKDTAETEPQN